MPVQDKQGRIERWFGTCTDIDALKRAEEIAPAYAMAHGGMKRGISTMIIEEKDLI